MTEHTFALAADADARYRCTACGRHFHTRDAARKHWRSLEGVSW